MKLWIARAVNELTDERKIGIVYCFLLALLAQE